MENAANHGSKLDYDADHNPGGANSVARRQRRHAIFAYTGLSLSLPPNLPENKHTTINTARIVETKCLWRQLLTLGHTPGVQERPKVALTRVPSRFSMDEPLLISSKARVVETKDYTFIAELPLVWYAWDHLAGSENQLSLMLSCCSQS